MAPIKVLLIEDTIGIPMLKILEQMGLRRNAGGGWRAGLEHSQ
jgi:hypothetical protein